MQGTDPVPDPVGTENTRRFARPHVKDVVHRHTGGIRFHWFPPLIRVGEEIRHLAGLAVLRPDLCLDLNEVHRHIPELETHGRSRQKEVGLAGQTDQGTIALNQIGAIGGSHVTQDSGTILAIGEDGMAFGHGLGPIGNLKASSAIIAERPQGLPPNLQALTGFQSGLFDPIDLNHPLQLWSLTVTHAMDLPICSRLHTVIRLLCHEILK